MKGIRRFIQIIYCVYAVMCFIIIMFLVLPFVIVFSLFGIKGGNLVYRVCHVWGIIWYACIGIWHREIYEAPHDKNKQYIFVANHSSYMDIPAVMRCMHQPIRVLGKSETVKIPVFGWIYKAAVILVERDSAEKRARSVRALRAALRRGISIFIFPEGTFNETNKPLKEFYDGAFRVAIETQTPIKPLLFVDTLDRMHWRGIFELTPGRSAVVFMKEISIHNYTMKQLPQLKQYVHDVMDEGLRRYRKYNSSSS
jgi:1-acyl-sn-glycerol-3-phosphate acyltransferase